MNGKDLFQTSYERLPNGILMHEAKGPNMHFPFC